MKNRILTLLLSLVLSFSVCGTAFAADETSSIRVSVSELSPGYYLCAVWDGNELLTFFDYTVGTDGKLDTTVDVGKKLENGHELDVGISGANVEGGKSVTQTAVVEDGETPVIPDRPSTPSTPSRPSSSGRPNRPSGSTNTSSKPSTPSTQPEEPEDEPDNTPEPAPAPTPAAVSYADVPASAWYYEAVQSASTQGLMTGTAPGVFSPDGVMTRAMVWTVLARMDGADTSGSGAEWYKKAQSWAQGKGISDGTEPNGYITREQFVTMLWRSKGSPVADYTLDSFSDNSKISDYAQTAVRWAVKEGILTGSDRKLDPQGGTTRAQAAAILTRFTAKNP